MKLFRIILIMLLFVSCRPAKQITELNQSSSSAINETTESSTTGQSDEKQSSDQITQTINDIVDQVKEKASIRIYEYNPTLPVDPGTGKPPTVREIHLDSNKESVRTDQSKSIQVLTEERKKTDQGQILEKSGKESIIQSTKAERIIIEKPLAWYQVFFIRAGQLFCVLVLCSIFLISYRFLPKISTIIRVLFKLKK